MPRPAPLTKQQFHARAWSKLLRHIRARRLLSPGDRILVAVSGGPDSVCLAHFLAKLSERMNLKVYLLHAHHGLRGRSADRDAKIVQELGARLGLPVFVRNFKTADYARSSGRSLEDAGRALRYQAIAREAKRLGCNKAATGHHLDDQAETVILNLLRGTKAAGLAGIPVKRPLQGTRSIELIRPLLCLTREEVMEYVRHHRLRYGVDQTNRSLKFLRNWVRWKALPLLENKSPKIRQHLALIAEDTARRLKQATCTRFESR